MLNISFAYDGDDIRDCGNRVTAHSVDSAWVIVEDIFENDTLENADDLLNRFIKHFGAGRLAERIIEAMEENDDDVTDIDFITIEVQQKRDQLCLDDLALGEAK